MALAAAAAWPMVPRGLAGPTHGRESLAPLPTDVMGFLALILGCALVALTAALVAASLRLTRAVDFLLAFYVIGAAELALAALVVSPVHELTRAGLLVVATVLFALAAVVWQLRGRPSPPSLRAAVGGVRDACRDPVVAVLAVAVSLAVAYAVVLSIATPANDYDALWYHLARAAFWRQQHAVSYISGANDLRLNVFPPVAEITSAWTMVLDGSERYASLFQVLALLALLVGVAGIARRVGLDRRAAILGALLFATLPVVSLQAGTPLNDLTVASFLVVTVYFLLSDGRLSLPLSALSLALAVGTKATALLALPILLLIAAVLCPRRRLGLAIVAGLAGIIVGSFWYAVNLVEKGNAIPRFAPLDEKRIHAPEHIRLPAHLARLAIDAVDPAGSVGRDRWLYALGAAVLLVLGVVAVRRGRSGAGLVAVVIAAALVLVPLLVPFVHESSSAGTSARSSTSTVRTSRFSARRARRGRRHPSSPGTARSASCSRSPASFLSSARSARAPAPRDDRAPARPVRLDFVLVAAESVTARSMAGTSCPWSRSRRLHGGSSQRCGRSPGLRGQSPSSRSSCPSSTTRRSRSASTSSAGARRARSGASHGSGHSPPRGARWGRGRGGPRTAHPAGRQDCPAIRQDDVSYPYFGGRLDRKVVFLGKQRVRNDMDWLVEAPGFDVVPCRSGWTTRAARRARLAALPSIGRLRAGLAVDGERRVRRGFPRAAFDHALPGRPPQTLAKGWIAKQPFDRHAQSPRVARGHEQPRDSVLDDVDETADRRRDDRSAVRHRLPRNDAVALAA